MRGKWTPVALTIWIVLLHTCTTSAEQSTNVKSGKRVDLNIDPKKTLGKDTGAAIQEKELPESNNKKVRCFDITGKHG